MAPHPQPHVGLIYHPIRVRTPCGYTPLGYRLVAMSTQDAPTHGYTQDKAAYARRLKRIEGQVRGIQRMIDEDTYCIDVLTQISAIQSALKSVSLGLMEEHLGHCVKHAVEHAHDLSLIHI